MCVCVCVCVCDLGTHVHTAYVKCNTYLKRVEAILVPNDLNSPCNSSLLRSQQSCIQLRKMKLITCTIGTSITYAYLSLHETMDSIQTKHK